MEAPTISQLRSGPPTISLLTAAAAIGIGRTKAYELAKRDEFPVAVRRVGATYRLPVAELLRFLHANETVDRALPYPRESPHRHRRLRSLRALRGLPRSASAWPRARPPIPPVADNSDRVPAAESLSLLRAGIPYHAVNGTPRPR
jgi:hypothetical protein